MSVPSTIVVSLIAGGCVTSSAMKVGSARELPTSYREVQLSGTTLQIRYETSTWYEVTSTIWDAPDRWTSVSLDSLPWVALDRLESTPPSRDIPLECSLTRSTPKPAPAMVLHAYTRPFKRWYSRDAPGYEAPLAAYVDQAAPGVLVFVRANSGDGQRIVTSLRLNSCSYRQPWAPYARVALVPLAVVADIVLSPFYGFAALIALAGAGGTGH